MFLPKNLLPNYFLKQIFIFRRKNMIARKRFIALFFSTILHLPKYGSTWAMFISAKANLQKQFYAMSAQKNFHRLMTILILTCTLLIFALQIRLIRCPGYFISSGLILPPFGFHPMIGL